VADALFRTDAVTKQFGQIEALADLSVDFSTGTIGLVGPNGSGKTTLIRLLLGLLQPTSGSLSVLGHDPQTEPLLVRERVGYMPEHDCLSPEMSGVGFVAYMGTISGMPREAAMSRAHDMLEFVGLAEQRYRKIKEYSVGMRQRIKLAQAIVHDPPLCFLDEPTSGLDPKGREEMLGLIAALGKIGGRSFVISTHLLPDVEGLVDQVLLLTAGRALAAGPVEHLLSSRAAETVIRVKGDPSRFIAAMGAKGFDVCPTGADLHVALRARDTQPVFQSAFETQTQIRYLGPAVNTIEDLFLSLVETPRAGAQL
jgi:ABC-2 type transport system ATP-binding protein